MIEKTGLSHTMVMPLPVTKEKFTELFDELVDDGSTSFLLTGFEVFSSSQREYKGMVYDNGFKIRRRRKFFDGNLNYAIAEAVYSEVEGEELAEIKITGLNDFVVLYYFLLIVMFPVFFNSLYFEGVEAGTRAFIIAHTLLMLLLPLYAINRSVKKLKETLQRDFYILSNKPK